VRATSISLEATGSGLSDGWRRWLAENYMNGIPEAELSRILLGTGATEAQVANELEELHRSPYIHAGLWAVQRLRKIECTLDIYQSLRSLSTADPSVPCRRGLTREQFLEQHYSLNRPVILEDLASSWKAVSTWTPDYLKQKVGAETIEIMAGREADGRYEVNSDAHRTSIRFSDYVDMVMRASTSNDFYLVANNHFLERPGAAPLWADFEIDDRYLDPGSVASTVFFWFGPAGTLTPLHHDTSNVLLAQVRGRKRVKLISSLYVHRLYNEVSVYSEVDADQSDLERHPLFRDVPVQEVELRPGEALFIPVGWWHWVQSRDVSLSLSFTNFVFPNRYDWELPQIIR
jgi:ribosomal protein L16 Arg81 hydroxylase